VDGIPAGDIQVAVGQVVASQADERLVGDESVDCSIQEAEH